jgi:hypothetical protein
MKAQSKYNYDSTILGLENLYRVNFNGDFFINAPFILKTNKTITTGLTYVLVDNQKGAGVRMTDVILLDVYYYERVIHLILQDFLSYKTFTIGQHIECPEIDCTWILIDLNYFIDKMNANAIRKYCKKCHYADVNSIAGSKSKQNRDDDLLDFDFSK